MAKNVINFADIKGIREIPSRFGWKIVENFAIEAFCRTKHTHSTDLYDFRWVDNRNGIHSLFYGMFEGANSNLAPEIANQEPGDELHKAMHEFAKSAPTRAKHTNKCLITEASDNITLIAAACERGTIIGGWYNSQGDRDIALQMLAYCMYAFAALNYVFNPEDNKLLKERTVDTIPDDSRFGKYPSEKAEAILVAAFYSREERMRNRLRRNSTSLS